MSKGLGKNQKAILNCMLERGPYPGYGWIFSTHSETLRLINSLVNRGLVEYDSGVCRYVLSEAGKTLVAENLSNGTLFRRIKNTYGDQRDFYMGVLYERGFLPS